MRLLLHGQSYWTKGAYGRQSGLLIKALMAQGHTVAQAMTYGSPGRLLFMNGIQAYPLLNDQLGQDIIQAHAENFGADYVLSLGDVYVFDPRIWGNGFKWLAWVTVDSMPLWYGIRDVLPKATRVIAYSQYGQRALQAGGFEADYIPLAFDPEAYYPVPLPDARNASGLPHDRFIVGMVQANRGQDNRKNFFGQIEAFRAFQLRHTDAYLHLHTCMSPARGGFDLNEFCEEMGMVQGRDYGVANEYAEILGGLSNDDMRNLYNSFDVLLQATKAEGFGVPALEASACRKPVVYTDYAALPEATHFGYRVEYEREWSPRGSWYARPVQASIVDALERAYASQAYDINKGEPTLYRSDLVADNYWTPFLDKMAQALEPERLAA